MPMHMYPFHSATAPPTQNVRPKRRQVKNACTKCQKACKKCDDARPCLRCVKYGISEECVDSKRKERKKGLKRGPYKKRDGKVRAATVTPSEPDFAAPQAVVPTPLTPTHSTADPFMGSYIVQNNHAIPFYSQCPATSKPVEGSAYYQPYFFTPAPQPPHGVHEADPASYISHQPYQSSLVSQFPAIYPQFLPASRSDGQAYYSPGPAPAPTYPTILYHKSTFSGPIPQGHEAGK
ncbi:hypothetical protein AX16_004189 [Volvariella volvacea WC 439]|nr:hypothetical protein AX16_004189 [Volvariella volvacea WC 439]